MTREVLLGPDHATVRGVPPTSSMTLINASSMASRPQESTMKDSLPSSSQHSSVDSLRTRRKEDDERELQLPMPFSVCMCLTKAAMAVDVSDEFRWPTTRLMY